MKLGYKIIAAVISLVVIIVLACAPLIYIGIESAAAQLLVTIGQYAGNDKANEIVNQYGQAPDHIGIDVSFMSLFDEDAKGTADLVKMFSDGDSADTMKVLEPVIAPAIVFVVVLALLVICAIVTAVLAFAVKDNRKVICSAVAGVFLSIMVPSCFEAVAAPFLDGTITLSKLAGSSWLSLLGDIDAVELSSTFWAVPAVFAAVILWTVLYNYTLPADEKKKRLELIGEADSE